MSCKEKRDHHKIAFSSTEFDQDEFGEFLGYVQKYKIKCIEIWSPKHITLENAPRVGEHLKREGIEIICVSSWSRLNMPTERNETIKRIEETIEIAALLKASYVNFYCGPNYVKSSREALAELAEHLKPLLELAAKKNVNLVMENEFDVFGEDPERIDPSRKAEDLLELCQKVNADNFGLTFDPCNFYFAGEEPFPYAFELLKEWVKYVHVKDGYKIQDKQEKQFTESKRKIWNDGDRQKYICSPIGSGALNWSGFLSALETAGYQGYLSIEPHTGVGVLDEVYSETVAYLQRWITSNKHRE